MNAKRPLTQTFVKAIKWIVSSVIGRQCESVAFIFYRFLKDDCGNYIILVLDHYKGVRTQLLDLYSFISVHFFIDIDEQYCLN